jgi:hypothetical protein
MDNSFTIKPRAGAQKSYSPRDPVPVRESVETDLDTAKTANAAGDGGSQQRDPRQRHAPQDVVADPELRDVINRENDVRTQASGQEHPDLAHPDQALLRQRAYRTSNDESESPADHIPNANIEA